MQIGPGRQVWTRVKFLLTHLPGIKHVQTEKSAMGQKQYTHCVILKEVGDESQGKRAN